MSSPPALPGAAAWLRAHAAWLCLGGIAAAGLLVLWGLAAPRVALGGLLAGLLFWLGIALGAYALLAVHALTGGRWLAAFFPVLAAAVVTLPVFALFALPLLLQADAVWPWVGDPGAARHPDVARWYLNLPGFLTRGAVALAGWSLLGLLLVGSGARRPGLGAAALVFHAVALSALGLDWVLSLEPAFHSTAFGMWLGVLQLLAALAWCALLETEPAGTRGKAGDLAQMLMAAALGAAYLGFVQYLVVWYGNLPHKTEWYLERMALPWLPMEVASLGLAAILPVLALLPAVTRRSPRALAWVGAGVLVGVLLRLLWLVGPGFGPLAVLSGLLGTVAVGGIWLGLAGGPIAARLTQEMRHGT
ncbi:hypothetical protein JYK14_17605 [Siccirubricoccus sp. KC 17139]|uniref:Uncharacterized protein n=1 Tax=Siccirubricoccus soli TaxID=2899147 RepID=A0ABT1D7T0_9PROT|nr:hypothetical protein [Siccirubricoccus soli]MCO6417961.1 hypothetical protein [Siccirubricoccus soli]MCP2684096.1 hypothetical protein [Siccirubricoccus soli]